LLSSVPLAGFDLDFDFGLDFDLDFDLDFWVVAGL
jgi:hypothetical protein